MSKRVVSFVVDVVPALVTLAVIGWAFLAGKEYVREHDALKAEVVALQEDNKRLVAANAAINKLKTIALQMGTEPVTITGRMHIVVEGMR